MIIVEYLVAQLWLARRPLTLKLTNYIRLITPALYMPICSIAYPPPPQQDEVWTKRFHHDAGVGQIAIRRGVS